MDTNLFYGLKDGKLIHINDVDSGLECGCICPACSHLLVAKKGQDKKFHFAHHESRECEFGFETTIRFMARNILDRLRIIILPENFIECGSYKYSYPERKVFVIKEIELRKETDNNIPDIILNGENGPVLVQVLVTHEIDSEKYYRIRKLDMQTVKIDFHRKKSKLISDESEDFLEHFLTADCKYSSWIYNSATEKFNKEFEKNLEKKNVVNTKNSRFVEDCPVNDKDLTGYSSANYNKQCNSCEYFIDGILRDPGTKTQYIICSGNIRNTEFFRKHENHLIKK